MSPFRKQMLCFNQNKWLVGEKATIKTNALVVTELETVLLTSRYLKIPVTIRKQPLSPPQSSKLHTTPGFPGGSSQYRRASEAPRAQVCLLYEPLPPCLGGDRNCKNLEEWDLGGNEQNCQSCWKIAADSCCVFSCLWFVAVSFTHFKIFIYLPQVFVAACKLIVVACGI